MPSNAPCIRKCAACREHAPKSELIRVCRSRDGRIFVDDTGRAEGRGVWIHPTKACVDLALKKRAINAALKCAVPEEVAKELYARV